MHTFVVVYLAIGFLLILALFGWLAVSAIRLHGVRNAARRAARTYAEELPLYGVYRSRLGRSWSRYR